MNLINRWLKLLLKIILLIVLTFAFVFELHIGTWTSGADMTSLQFTSVPEHFVFNDELIIYQFMPTIYVYFSNKNTWETQFCKLEFFPHNLPNNMPMLTLKTMPCYIGKYCNLYTMVDTKEI